MKKARFAAVSAALVCAFALLLNAASAATEATGLEFVPVGSATREIDAETSTTYQWFIYNGYNTTYLLNISVDPSSGPGWDSELDTMVTVLSPQESLRVNLTVHASGDVDARWVNQTVFFVFQDVSKPLNNFLKTGQGHTKMIPFWSSVSAGKNKLFGQFENPLPPPFEGNYATFVLSVGLWAAIAIIFAYVVGPLLRVFTKRTKTDLDDRIIGILHMPIFVLVIIFGIVESFTILPLTRVETGVLYRLYVVALISILTFVMYKVYKEIIIFLGRKWASRTKTEIDEVLIPLLDKVGGIVILVFGAIGIVSYMGYNITFLLAGVGVFGLVIAFAAQDALSNFFSGMALLLDRPFAEGDYIQITTGEICRVDKIGIRSCRLYDVFQNNYIILPNNKLVNDKIANLMEPDAKGVIEVAVNVVHGTDVGKVERILEEVAASHPEVLKDKGNEPAVRLSNFGESALEFKLFAWVGDFMTKWRVAHELRKEIDRRFSEEGVKIAVPERTVHIKEEGKA